MSAEMTQERIRELDELARAAFARDQERARELNKLRAVYYYGKNEGIREAIKATINKLPLRAQQFAFSQCCFFSLSPLNAGYSFPAEEVAGKWIIFISELNPPEGLEHVIAHEIAHGIAGVTGDKEVDELRAESLVQEWGWNEPLYPSLQWLFEQWAVTLAAERTG